MGPGLTSDRITEELNQYLWNLNESVIYVSMSGTNRFGDIHLTPADSRLSELEPYLNGLRGRLETIGLPEFIFKWDTVKGRIIVGMVPVTRTGQITWELQHWAGDEGFRELAEDRLRSNPGVNVVSRPVWVGNQRKFHTRRQSTGGLRLVVELNDEMRRIMARGNQS